MSLPGGYALSPGPVWTDLASAWPIRFDIGPTEPGHHFPAIRGQAQVDQAHARCGRCGQSVLCLSPDLSGLPYQWTPADLIAGVLAHIRRSHEDIAVTAGP